MSKAFSKTCCWIVAIAAVLTVFSITAYAQNAPNASNGRDGNRVGNFVAQLQGPARTEFNIPPKTEGEHPLMPALRWADSGLKQVEQNVQDYSAYLIKQERINGKLAPQQTLFVKVRHKPFSAYTKFVKPDNLAGQEALYVDGANNGKMWAHTVGIRNTIVGTVSLKPTSSFAMEGQRYPITELGVQNLVRRLLEVGMEDAKYGECDVKFLDNAKINDRTCLCIQVLHPVPRKNFRFHLARIYVDKELNLPIRYEAYDWPRQKGGQPELLEAYTYLNLKINNGFTDNDFDPRNPNFQFDVK
ncbi:MAG: DUF1571 domain-containing protein [Planctomycetia bacterium]|jgi:hypothetical protein